MFDSNGFWIRGVAMNVVAPPRRAIATASLRYWRDLRSYSATAAMRQAARRGQPDWRAWQVSIELSQQRCEQPLIDAGAGARAVWLELAPELTRIYA